MSAQSIRAYRELSAHVDVDLIYLRQARLDALYQPDPDLEAALEDLETVYVELLDKTTPAEREAIGEFWQEALEVYGSAEEIFANYPDAAGMLLALQTEPVRNQMREQLRFIRERNGG